MLKPTKEFVAAMEVLRSILLTSVIVIPSTPFLVISLLIGMLFFVPTLGHSMCITKMVFDLVNNLVLNIHRHCGREVE